jgi:hypothetical protein
MKRQPLWQFLKTVVTQWLEDEPFQLATAPSYYTPFLLAPVRDFRKHSNNRRNLSGGSQDG